MIHEIFARDKLSFETAIGALIFETFILWKYPLHETKLYSLIGHTSKLQKIHTVHTLFMHEGHPCFLQVYLVLHCVHFPYISRHAGNPLYVMLIPTMQYIIAEMFQFSLIRFFKQCFIQKYKKKNFWRIKHRLRNRLLCTISQFCVVKIRFKYLLTKTKFHKKVFFG